MPPLLLLALLAPSTALGATTGTVTVLLKNNGVGSFAPSDPIGVTADGDALGFDKFVNAPTAGSFGPGGAFTAPVTGLLTYSGIAGTYEFRVSYLDGSGPRVLTLASGVRFPGTGNYWVSRLGVTTTNPGSEHSFDVANDAPISLSIATCAPAPANPTQDLSLVWRNPGPRPGDFERFTLQRAPSSGTTWTTIGTYSAWAVTNFTDTSLLPATTYRYRLVNQDRYDAVTAGTELTCTTAGGDGDGDGQVSTAFGGTDCDDTSAAVYRGAPEVPNDSVDQDCDGSDLILAVDTDADGHADFEDNCFKTPNPDQIDLDLDGAGDACDTDDDNDGFADGVDICPEWYDPLQADLDADLVGDACDDDDDDDGVTDDVDLCPRVVDPEQYDLDHDLVGDACDGDDDGDGISDLVDVCPAIPDVDQTDTDGDGIGDACDPLTDSDGDLVADGGDNCPLDANAEQFDTDADGAGDDCDVDDDNDGVDDLVDVCPVNADPLQEDTDVDSLGNACDEDDDNDAVLDEDDNCVFDANASQADLDGDAVGDTCDDDDDGDGIADAIDNCVYDANADQFDNDDDGQGDTCDADDDDDTLLDDVDNCPFLTNLDQADLDVDLLGDVCDPDDDGDGVLDLADNCPVDWNVEQLDTDADGQGDICDPDDDDDGWSDVDDLCATVSDPDQADADCDGGGDACDDDRDGDEVPNDLDTCPDVAAYPIELVVDGCPDDACDLATWIGERDTSEIASQMMNSLRTQANHACTAEGTEEGIDKLGALASHASAQRGRKVAPDTADQIVEVATWIETAWTCEQAGVDCDLLDPCVE